MKSDQSQSWLLFLQILNLVHVIMEDCGDDFERMQIEPKALFIMSVLDENPEPAQLAKTLMLPKPTVTFLIKRLEEMGYVKRANNPADLRKYRISLTKAGRKCMEIGRQAISEAWENRLEKLNEQQKTQFFSSITMLQNSREK